MNSTFRALKYKNFRLFFPGLMTAQIGIWTQNVAVSWLIYDITKSPFVMGIIMFISALPLFIITPFAGVFIDKFDKHKMLKIIQNLYAIQALLMSVLTLSGHIEIYSIAILNIFLNILASIDSPLRQSMFVLLVEDKQDLSNAIALNSACFNAARLIGPAVAGLLLICAGAGFCFLINFICFIPVNILVNYMQICEIKNNKIQTESITEGLKEGLNYINNNKRIKILMIYIALFSFLAMTYPMLMPIYTAEILHQNAGILGVLMSSAGIGALGSSFVLASKNTIKGLKTFLSVAALLIGIGFIIIGCTKTEIIAILAMFLIGIGTIGTLTSINTLIQAVVDDEIRGRVMSIHSICYLGTLSISNFFAGSFTHLFGISNAMIFLGLSIIFICIIFYIKLRKMNYTFNQVQQPSSCLSE